MEITQVHSGFENNYSIWTKPVLEMHWFVDQNKPTELAEQMDANS